MLRCVFFFPNVFVHTCMLCCVLHAGMQNVVKFSAKEELTGQWSEQMPFPLKPTSRCRKEGVFCVEGHMCTWGMTCLTLDWFWLVQSVATAWWAIFVWFNCKDAWWLHLILHKQGQYSWLDPNLFIGIGKNWQIWAFQRHNGICVYVCQYENSTLFRINNAEQLVGCCSFQSFNHYKL